MHHYFTYSGRWRNCVFNTWHTRVKQLPYFESRRIEFTPNPTSWSCLLLLRKLTVMCVPSDSILPPARMSWTRERLLLPDHMSKTHFYHLLWQPLAATLTKSQRHVKRSTVLHCFCCRVLSGLGLILHPPPHALLVGKNWDSYFQVNSWYLHKYPPNTLPYCEALSILREMSQRSNNVAKLRVVPSLRQSSSSSSGWDPWMHFVVSWRPWMTFATSSWL